MEPILETGMLRISRNMQISRLQFLALLPLSRLWVKILSLRGLVFPILICQ